MKKIIIPIALIMFFALSSEAQSRNQLKGPKAKNYKPWMNKEKSQTAFVVKNVETKQGPEAKNNKVWSDENKNAETLAVNFGSAKTSLKGPKAKNYKPWEQNATEANDPASQTFANQDK